MSNVPGGGSVPEVSALEARSLIDGGHWLVDVREPDEWAAGHAPEAIHIPLGELSSRLDELSGATSIVCVCRGGGRSARAAAALLANGYDATNLAGGMRGWEASRLPVISDSGPGTVI